METCDKMHECALKANEEAKPLAKIYLDYVEEKIKENSEYGGYSVRISFQILSKLTSIALDQVKKSLENLGYYVDKQIEFNDKYSLYIKW